MVLEIHLSRNAPSVFLTTLAASSRHSRIGARPYPWQMISFGMRNIVQQLDRIPWELRYQCLAAFSAAWSAKMRITTPPGGVPALGLER